MVLGPIVDGESDGGASINWSEGQLNLRFHIYIYIRKY